MSSDPSNVHSDNDIIVECEYGTLQGLHHEGLKVFRGIPYAKPPINELRFQAPQRLDPWNGVMDATVAGPASMQVKGVIDLIEHMDEDCLYLNISSPGTDDKKRPVLFWIHGGGFTSGSGDQVMYSETDLPKRGDVVLVRINYRLGALGFADFSSLLKSHSKNNLQATSNNGLRDMIAALEWVRNNIENFGGDPDNVTIFGESAGGMAVSCLMGSPKAEGLFHKVIAQSGACHMTILPNDAERVAGLFLENADIALENVDEIFNLDTKTLLKAQVETIGIKFDNAGRENHLPLSNFAYLPIIGDDILPEEPLDRINKGCAKNIPFMTGTTMDEWMFFIQLTDPGKNTLDLEALKKVCKSRIPNNSDKAVDIYMRALDFDHKPELNPVDIFSAIETDRFFRIPSIRMLESQSKHQEKCFSYLFTYETTFLDGKLKSCHAIDVPFVFGSYYHDFPKMFVGEGEHLEELANTCMDAWINFAKTGTPHNEDWPPYNADSRLTMELGDNCKVLSDPMSDEREFWQDLL